jgi:precorrin-2 dehydrogenase/sirohydrochlorin ferrochelatase
LYPVSLKLEGRRCLVVGGGPIALRKTRDLLACAASVRVVAPEWKADFAALDGRADLSRVTREFLPEDLEGAFLVIAATDDPDTQTLVAREAEVLSILCNVVDVNRLCSFYLPATLRRGSLSVSVATDGKYPILSVVLRDWLAGRIGPQLGPALEWLAEAREAVRLLHPRDSARRGRLLKQLLTPDALDLLLEDRLDEFEAHRRTWQSSLAD